MKQVQLIGLLLSLMCLSCNLESEKEEMRYDRALNLKAGHSYYIAGGDLTLRIKDITDSRCPVGVVCVWQGEATVWLEIGNTPVYNVVLSTLHHPADTVNNHIFRLIDVLPYPVYGKEVPEKEKIVVLEVKKI